MKNRDRDDEHRRRRRGADDREELDGRAVAAALYGGDVSELEDLDEETDEPEDQGEP